MIVPTGFPESMIGLKTFHQMYGFGKLLATEKICTFRLEYILNYTQIVYWYMKQTSLNVDKYVEIHITSEKTKTPRHQIIAFRTSHNII